DVGVAAHRQRGGRVTGQFLRVHLVRHGPDRERQQLGRFLLFFDLLEAVIAQERVPLLRPRDRLPARVTGPAPGRSRGHPTGFDPLAPRAAEFVVLADVEQNFADGLAGQRRRWSGGTGRGTTLRRANRRAARRGTGADIRGS